MLVLTRKINEEIVIHTGGDVVTKLKITKVDRNQVRIAFEAKPEIKIDRLEAVSYTHLRAHET